MVRTLLALLFTLGCGATERVAERSVAEPAPEHATETVDETPASDRDEPTAETTPTEASSRLAVPPPTDLASAIAARLPTIELVPDACPAPDPGATVSVTDERVCLFGADGRIRAMRRFATSSDPAVSAARTGDDVVFSVVDPGETTTRYDGHVWRWELGADRYTGIIGSGDIGYWVAVDETSFGVLITSQDHFWVFDAGTLEQVRLVEMGPPVAVGGQTYVFSTSGRNETLSTVRRDGPRLVLERVARYPVVIENDALRAHFPGGQRLVVSAYPHGDTTTLHVVDPPATEVRELVVAVRRPRAIRWVDGALQLRSAAGVVSVDLTTGALTPAAEWVEAPVPLGFRSFWDIGVTSEVVTLRASPGVFTLGASGIERGPHPDEEAPASSSTGCRCHDTTLQCGDTEVPLACTDVAELERISDPYSETRERSTLYSTRFRIDRLEPDLVRVTRLADGARLWMRLSDADVIVAQADDGAFSASGEVDLSRYTVRWGRDLLGAPVEPLAPLRARFERPTLITEFFAGRPLPTSEH